MSATATLAPARKRPTREQLRRLDYVPVRPFREAVEERLAAGERMSDMALRAGFSRSEPRYPGRYADTSGFQRTLGMLPWCSGSTSRQGIRYRYSRYVKYDTAVRICRGLELDPVDMGV